jgi:hypothetical protein
VYKLPLSVTLVEFSCNAFVSELDERTYCSFLAVPRYGTNSSA